MATAFLAGMFILSAGASAPFAEADRTSVRVVANAGVAALAADVQSSPVGAATSLLRDARVERALGESGHDLTQNRQIAGVFREVANESTLQAFPAMTVALMSADHAVIAQMGANEEQLSELAGNPTYQRAIQENIRNTFAIRLDSGIFSVRIHDIYEERPASYLVAIQPIALGESSFVRRVLGASYPAALIQDGEVVGEPIGSAPVSELQQLVTDSRPIVPTTGSSETQYVGVGADQRIGSVGRFPGPLGQGEHAMFFAVVSPNSAGFATKDLAQVLSSSMDKQEMSTANWSLLAGFLALAIAISIYVFHFEVSMPLRRLRNELTQISQGTQHQVYFDLYSGDIGELARTIARWIEEKTEGERKPTGPHDRRSREQPIARRRTSSRHRTVGTGSSAQVEAGPHMTRPLPTVSSAVEARAASNPSVADPDGFFDPFDELLGEDAAAADGNDELDALTEGLPQEIRDILTGPLPIVPSPPPVFDEEATLRRRGTKTIVAFAPAPPSSGREAHFREVYDSFLDTKRACGEPTDAMTFERFLAKVEENERNLRSDPSVIDVRFSVYIKDGKAALKAKVVRDE